MNEPLERYRKAMTGEIQASPVEQLMGIKPVEIAPGQVIFEMEATQSHSNPQGTLNGGITSTLADIAMGVAFGTTLQLEESFTTIELKINFLKPIWNGKITADAKVMKKGNTVGLIDCSVYDENQVLVAYATSTCMILRGDKAKGR
ncbi:PaaI family thioesterase [Paenibacillus sp. MER TA 81-3]|uniref:PaaI family thioesterase n=1 Tax=Paenibacillus sp. MER TA 81-3 TaxID=2939573 RepID=UPI00203E80FA|nr:PaaI family thioesterase [Paenibacillus sp. MER TA 81-3]MCM3337822.1 PaaI family thioesterase [Paenibacillus sp. MER TA 81-3]